MKTKKDILILFCVALLFFSVGISFALPENFGFCQLGDFSCVDFFSEKIAQPLVLISLSLIIISIFLFFTKPQVFKIWSKFALITIPLIILWIINTPVQCGGGYIAMCLTKEMVSIFSSVGFLIISLGIIVYKSFTLRTKNNVEMGK